MWNQSDAVIHAVAFTLLLISLASWYIVIGKAFMVLRARVSIARALAAGRCRRACRLAGSDLSKTLPGGDR